MTKFSFELKKKWLKNIFQRELGLLVLLKSIFWRLYMIISFIKRFLLIILLTFISPIVGLVLYPIGNYNGGLSSLLFLEFVTFIIFLYKVIRKPLKNILNYKIQLKMFFILLFLIVFISAFYLLINGVPNVNLSKRIFELSGYNSLKLSYVYIFMSSIVSPILEEFFFRGIIFSYLHKYLNSFFIIISSIIFGLSHTILDFPNLIYQFIIGIILGISRKNTHGIVIPNYWINNVDITAYAPSILRRHR